MKIHPYLTVIQGQKDAGVRRYERKGASHEADAFRVPVENRASHDVVNVVYAENVRASSQPPLRDLGEAETVLEQIQQSLSRMTKSQLSNVHRLEGLVNFYRV